MKRGFAVLLLAVLTCGHGFEAPVQVAGASVAVPPPIPFSFAPIPVSLQMWLALWSDGWGEVRAGLTEPASPRLQNIYAGVLRRAKAWEFDVQPPTLMQTKVFVAELLPDPPERFYGRYFVGPNRILLNREWTDRMTDDEVRVLLAHELGHAIDHQSERIGHWTFRRAYLYNRQGFADYIAMLLIGVREVRHFNDSYIYVRAGDAR